MHRTAILFSIMLWQVTAAEVMPVYQPPFVTNSSAAAIKQKAIAGPGKIDFGSKSLRYLAGKYQILDGPKEIASLYPHFATRHSRRYFHPGALLFAIDRNEEWGFTGTFPADEQLTPIRIQEKGILENDGVFRINCNWETEASKESILESCYYISIPIGLAQGSRVILNNQSYTVDNKEGVLFQSRASGQKVTLFADTASRMIELTFPDTVTLVGRIFQGRTFLLRVHAPKTAKELRLLLDLTKGSDGNTAKEFAGIDFYGTDRLWMPDFASLRNLLQNPSFESGLQFYNSSESGIWMYPDLPLIQDNDFYALESEAPYSGRYCLRMTAPAREMQGRIYSATVPLKKGTYTISFYARAVDECTLHVDPLFIKGKTPFNNGSGKFALTKDWKRYSYQITSDRLTPMVIGFGAISRTGGNSKVWLDAIQVESGTQATAFEGEAVNARMISANVFPVDSQQPIKFMFSSEKKTEGKVKCSLLDWRHRTISEQDIGYHNGLETVLNFSVPDNAGLYLVKFEFDCGKVEYHRLAVMNFMDGKHKLKDMFALAYGGGIGGIPYIGRIAKRLRDIGMGIPSSHSAHTETVETIYRKFGLKTSNIGIVNRFRADGKTWFAIYEGITDGKHKLIEDFRLNNPPNLTLQYREKFKEAVIRRANKTPWCGTWSFSGEDEAKWPDWAGLAAPPESYDSYIRLNLDFMESIRRRFPQARIMNSPPCNSRPEYGIQVVDRLLKAVNDREKFDVLSIHTYAQNPYGLDEQIKLFLQMADRNGYQGTPVIFPEGMHYGPYEFPQWGIISPVGGTTTQWWFYTLGYDLGWMEKRSAAWYARSYLTCLKYSPRVETAVSGAAWNFALDVELSPRIYQNAINALAFILGNSTFREDLSFAPKIKCLLFSDAENRPIAAVWNEDPAIDGGHKDAPWFRIPKSAMTCFDMTGGEFAVAEDSNTMLKFQATPFPVYFRGEPGSMNVMREAFLHAQAMNSGEVMPLQIFSRIVDSNNALVILQSMVARPYTGEFIIDGTSSQITVPALQKKELKVPLTNTLSDSRITQVQIPFYQAGSKSSPENLVFDAFVVKPFDPKKRWEGVPVIPFKNRVIIRPGKNTFDADFRGHFQVAYDSLNLYLRVEIKDNKFYRDPKSSWNNDTLQIYFDCFGDARGKENIGYDDNDYAYTILPEPSGKGAKVWRELSPDPQLQLANNAPPNLTFEDNIPADFKLIPGGYVYEVTLPAKYLLPINLKAGTVFGFCLFVNDRNDPEGVTSALTLTPKGTAAFRNPHLWPQVILVK